jgi:hypothetical protein
MEKEGDATTKGAEVREEKERGGVKKEGNARVQSTTRANIEVHAMAIRTAALHKTRTYRCAKIDAKIKPGMTMPNPDRTPNRMQTVPHCPGSGTLVPASRTLPNHICSCTQGRETTL